MKKTGKELLQPLTPILIILICTIIALAALIGLGLVSPFFLSRRWTWLIYLVGAILIFLIYRARERKSRRFDQPSEAQEALPASQTPEESPQDLETIRRRIRDLKTRKHDQPEE